jgi:hypothetical protein
LAKIEENCDHNIDSWFMQWPTLVALICSKSPETVAWNRRLLSFGQDSRDRIQRFDRLTNSSFTVPFFYHLTISTQSENFPLPSNLPQPTFCSLLEATTAYRAGQPFSGRLAAAAARQAVAAA